MTRVRAWFTRTVRATAILVRDRSIPRPLRWLAAFALLPIPGPVDEAVLLLLAPVFFLFYGEPMRDAWHRAITLVLLRNAAPALELKARMIRFPDDAFGGSLRAVVRRVGCSGPRSRGTGMAHVVTHLSLGALE